MKYTLVVVALLVGVAFAIRLPSSSFEIKIAADDWKVPALDHSLIEELEGKTSTWVAGSNTFLEKKSLAEIKHLLGFKRNPATRSKPFGVVSNKISALPATYDASKAYPKCTSIGAIQNQASCGSCWAFGCVESVTDRFCIHSNGSVNVQLSFSDEVCCGPDDGCFGGDAMDAWNYVQESGLVTAACYPYTIPTCPPAQQPCTNFVQTPDCVQQCVNGENWSSSKHYLRNAYSIDSDENSIMSEIYKNGPVEGCFDVYADFLNYKSGVYRHTSGGYLGGHCIKIIGWGVENNTKYWLINNSWTTSWGDNGQFKILRGNDECGIEDDVVAGLPKL